MAEKCEQREQSFEQQCFTKMESHLMYILYVHQRALELHRNGFEGKGAAVLRAELKKKEREINRQFSEINAKINILDNATKQGEENLQQLVQEYEKRLNDERTKYCHVKN